MRDRLVPPARIPAFLRGVTVLECLVVLVAGGGLFFRPDLAADAWAWAITPFNSRYTGAIYFAALVPLLVMAWTGRWSPGRVVLWMILAFTASIAFVMLIHREPFEWGRPGTWVFWALYLFLPLNSALFLYLLRHQPVPGSRRQGAGWQVLLGFVALSLGAYGVVLLLAPEAATSFWPWPVDAFHGRIYAATFLTPAVAALVILRRGAPTEGVVLGITLLTLGVLSLAGVAWASAAAPPERKVDYGEAGSLLFFGLNAVVAMVAVLLAWGQSRSNR